MHLWKLRSIDGKLRNWAKLEAAGLTGQVRSPSGSLPEGLGIIADDRLAGGSRPNGHLTISPARRMPFIEYNDLIQSMGWANVGIKLPRK